jgi:hypothetical protein
MRKQKAEQFGEERPARGQVRKGHQGGGKGWLCPLQQMVKSREAENQSLGDASQQSLLMLTMRLWRSVGRKAAEEASESHGGGHAQALTAC